MCSSDLKPREPPPAAPAPAAPFDLGRALAALAGRSPEQRRSITSSYTGARLRGAIQVTRVGTTFGFRLPEPLREGRTVEGRVAGSPIRVQIRFPSSRNAELDALPQGTELAVHAIWSGWEDIADRVTLDAAPDNG